MLHGKYLAHSRLSEQQLTLPSVSLATVPSLFVSVLQSNKVPVVQHPHHMHPLTPLITYSNDHFSPGSPPTHLSPDIDPKTGESAAAWAGARAALWGGKAGAGFSSHPI